MFSFSFVPRNLLISFLISSLTHRFFRSDPFNLEVSKFFLLSVIYLSFQCIIISEESCYNFYPLDFMVVCFMSQHIVYLGEHHMSIGEECVSRFLGMESPISTKPFSSISFSKASISLEGFSLIDLSGFD